MANTPDPLDVFNQGSTYLKSPQHDWLRKQRAHYPHIFNWSQIVFEPPPPIKRTAQLDSKRLKEKRHYPQLSTRSYLDDYF